MVRRIHLVRGSSGRVRSRALRVHLGGLGVLVEHVHGDVVRQGAGLAGHGRKLECRVVGGVGPSDDDGHGLELLQRVGAGVLADPPVLGETLGHGVLQGLEQFLELLDDPGVRGVGVEVHLVEHTVVHAGRAAHGEHRQRRLLGEAAVLEVDVLEALAHELGGDADGVAQEEGPESLEVLLGVQTVKGRHPVWFAEHVLVVGVPLRAQDVRGREVGVCGGELLGRHRVVHVLEVADDVVLRGRRKAGGGQGPLDGVCGCVHLRGLLGGVSHEDQQLRVHRVVHGDGLVRGRRRVRGGVLERQGRGVDVGRPMTRVMDAQVHGDPHQRLGDGVAAAGEERREVLEALCSHEVGDMGLQLRHAECVAGRGVRVGRDGRQQDLVGVTGGLGCGGQSQQLVLRLGVEVVQRVAAHVPGLEHGVFVVHVHEEVVDGVGPLVRHHADDVGQGPRRGPDVLAVVGPVHRVGGAGAD